MIELYKPNVEDLWFREKFLSDEETMSFNTDWGGTIPFPESEWQDWYDRWILCEDGKRFYRYLRDADSGEFVGEIAYHFDDERLLWLANIIIASEYRGKGYGKQGLKILCELAAERGLGTLYDDIAIDNPAIPLLIGSGFVEEYRTDDVVMLKKNLKKNKMVITEDYDSLMHYNELPERFRAGSFYLFEDEDATLREFINNFYEAAEGNGYIDLWDFTELMAFLDILRPADTDPVQNILTEAFMRSAQIQNALIKGMNFPDKNSSLDS